MTSIGPRLKRERQRLKLSQSALGAIGGVETNAQGNYENGLRVPRADYLSRISDAGVDIAYVVTGLTSRTRPNPHPDSDGLGRALNRLHENLHEMTQHLYQITRLLEAREQDARSQPQIDSIREDAEAITVAAVRLIYVTSRLK